MSDYVMEYKFEKKPKEITYFNDEPLQLSNELSFFHNKNIFRKELNTLQYIFKEYTGNSLVAPGIRDTYLKEEYSEKYLIILLTDNETVKKTNKIIEAYSEINIFPKNFILITKKDYMLLLTRDMEGLKSGIEFMKEIFTQSFSEYLSAQNFEDYVKIRPFRIMS